MGVVYLLGDWEREGVYKIGVTRGSIEKRIKKLQTGNSSEIYLVDYFETDHPFLVEKNLHLKFTGERIVNEWFDLSIEQSAHFKEYCREIEDMFDALKDNPFAKKYLDKHGTAK